MTDPIANLLTDWSTDAGRIIFRILLSLLLSAILGWERSSKRHAAGLRTFIVVSLASTVSMLVDLNLMGATSVTFPILSAATLVGIAIITVNSILYSSRNQIKGLTTSVGLWACAVLGLAIGAGLYTITLIMFAALLISLSFFPKLERYLKNRSNHFEIHLELKNAAHLPNFVSTIRELGLRIDDIESNPAYHSSGLSVYSISISISSAELKKYKTHAEIIEALRTLDYIYHIEEMN